MLGTKGKKGMKALNNRPLATLRSIMVISALLMLCGCTAWMIGAERKAYTKMGWLRVDPSKDALNVIHSLDIFL